MDTKRLYCLTGLPLSGKSRTGKLLASKTKNSVFISCGDIARSLVKTQEEQQQMESADLFQGEAALRAELKSRIDAADVESVFLDGFPRFGSQADHLFDVYSNLFPIVIDINAGDLQTLAQRAKARARDHRDFDENKFKERLRLAIKNQTEVMSVLNARLVLCYTIVSTSDDESVLKQFNRIKGFTP